LNIDLLLEILSESNKLKLDLDSHLACPFIFDRENELAQPLTPIAHILLKGRAVS
jgi:hypothetical protein